jgi:hypothetical protein
MAIFGHSTLNNLVCEFISTYVCRHIDPLLRGDIIFSSCVMPIMAIMAFWFTSWRSDSGIDIRVLTKR